jgi:hypothetical protein
VVKLPFVIDTLVDPLQNPNDAINNQRQCFPLRIIFGVEGFLELYTTWIKPVARLAIGNVGSLEYLFVDLMKLDGRVLIAHDFLLVSLSKVVEAVKPVEVRGNKRHLDSFPGTLRGESDRVNDISGTSEELVSNANGRRYYSLHPVFVSSVTNVDPFPR